MCPTPKSTDGLDGHEVPRDREILLSLVAQDIILREHCKHGPVQSPTPLEPRMRGMTHPWKVAVFLALTIL